MGYLIEAVSDEKEAFASGVNEIANEFTTLLT